MSESKSASAIARWISILLHPFAVFAALSLVAAWRLDPASLPRTAIGIAVAVAMVWAFVLQRRRSGRWGTVDASDRRERPIPYLAHSLNWRFQSPADQSMSHCSGLTVVARSHTGNHPT